MMAKPAWTGAGRFTRIPRKRILAALAALFIVMAGGSPIQAQEEAPLRPLPFGVRYEGGHGVEDVVYELVDERGNTVTLATLLLAPGDLYIDQENWLYEVTSLEGERVRVARRGKAAMPSGRWPQPPAKTAAAAQTEGAENAGMSIGIYHTHNAESYVPTSGTAFRDDGDVHQVGEALKDALEELGHRVIWTTESHLPHDASAYLRSRRTASDISRESPATIIDVHRDAIPDPDEYRTEIDGRRVAQVRLVVGRQNQNRQANLEYAKQIKALTDEEYPGLIKGIFHARGNYNQDLGPRMILMEFGTHTTTLEEAVRAAELMAQVIPAAAGLAENAGQRVGGGGWRTAGRLALLAVAGGIGWAVLNREGFDAARERLARFVQKARAGGRRG